MSFSQDAKRVINQPFDNIKCEFVESDPEPDQEETKPPTPQLYTSSPLAKTPMREVNNLKHIFIEKVAKRRHALQQASSPTSSSRAIKSRKLDVEPPPVDVEPPPPMPQLSSTVNSTLCYEKTLLVDDEKGDFIHEINTLEDLTCLPGVGKKLASSILENRPFRTFNDFETIVGKSRAIKLYKNF